MTKVAILGASGYSALELIKILLRHPHAQISVLGTRREDNPDIAEVHPVLKDRLHLECTSLDPKEIAGRAECVFLALPHKASMALVPELMEHGCRVIDLSADYRLTDPAVYEQWYDTPHVDAVHLSQAVYGLPEIDDGSIAAAQLIANPGCYPTSAILALAPFVQSDCIESTGIIIDSKSGVSGAGRSLKLTTHFPECNESVAAYAVGMHRHTPEIEQLLQRVGKQAVEVIFTPHLIPMDRGILTTIYANPVRPLQGKDAFEILESYYQNKPFVRVMETLPSTKFSVGTNYCDISVRMVRGRLVIISCLDNLIKGAAGAAVQNFNLMYGHSETLALI